MPLALAAVRSPVPSRPVMVRALCAMALSWFTTSLGACADRQDPTVRDGSMDAGVQDAGPGCEQLCACTALACPMTPGNRSCLDWCGTLTAADRLCRSAVCERASAAHPDGGRGTVPCDEVLGDAGSCH